MIRRLFARSRRALAGLFSAPPAPVPVPVTPVDRLHLQRLSDLLHRADR
jgi:hypothetical protein